MVGIARAKEYVITFSVIDHESPLLLKNWNKDANTPSFSNKYSVKKEMNGKTGTPWFFKPFP